MWIFLFFIYKVLQSIFKASFHLFYIKILLLESVEQVLSNGDIFILNRGKLALQIDYNNLYIKNKKILQILVSGHLWSLNVYKKLFSKAV